MELAPCFGNARACVLGRCCLLQGVLQRASHAFLAELARHTLADLVGAGGPTAALFLNQQPPDRPVARRRTRVPAQRKKAASAARAAKA